MGVNFLITRKSSFITRKCFFITGFLHHRKMFFPHPKIIFHHPRCDITGKNLFITGKFLLSPEYIFLSPENYFYPRKNNFITQFCFFFTGNMMHTILLYTLKGFYKNCQVYEAFDVCPLCWYLAANRENVMRLSSFSQRLCL